MKKIIFTFAIAIFTILVTAQNDTITNIVAAQRTDGSMIIDISYDLSGSLSFIISVQASFDGGVTFLPADSVSGDVGNGIAPAPGKYIEWKFGAEYPGQYSNEMQVKISGFQTPWSCGYQMADMDGNSYKTIQIGTQCWMAENLNVGTMISGSADQTDNGTIEKYCYDNTISNCLVYGGLYQWDEMMQYVNTQAVQGICTERWYLPTDEELKQLEGEVDSQYNYPDPVWNGTGFRGSDAGGNLKEAGTSHWSSPNTGGTNSSGFTALPGGYCSPGGNFSHIKNRMYLWSSSDNGSNAWYRDLHNDSPQIYRGVNYQTDAFSVRCLLSNQQPAAPANPLPNDGAVNVGADTTLSWTCSDPDGDALFYTIFFGENANPPLVITNHPDTFYIPGLLNYNTEYYWKIITVDAYGDSAVGPVWSFTTMDWSCGEPIGDIDGNIYKTIQIDTQCWMAEDLKTTTYKNGTPIPNVTDNNAWANLTTGAYVWFDNNIDWKEYYGAIYNWYAGIDPNGICPEGWHMPDDNEWSSLISFIGGWVSPHGNELKSCRQVNSPLGGGCNTNEHPRWNTYNSNYGTDDYGFSGLPAGFRYWDGTFSGVGDYATWWTGTEQTSGNGYYRSLSASDAFITEGGINKTGGMTVRCLKD
ncbi:MAG: hypothetical protein K8R53_06125 [Bacteroidales bacterium]|nr:hypothetical protein [Bacteroidales bacterium]